VIFSADFAGDRSEQA